ncbi:bifunctional ADP-dependent NAD(P)H-hydrate dehydratase/NAD(P)H-hydrate epimerase [Cellulomonas alba]|uniref:Bifunctional NAD(P)H-hydrate repair enzyme n=1 Tax=Cellulomonas alba TaxID=3053467 RepID=A0ABT7SDM4_9CELL|nr:bifunctional ADP-dependent NAD(P)H-hydrate dehydratase/NAD(P)H-hydrate epimerase [Cellulomonas alba]MDM7854287.1 NAD(P)H-hydrate dehydratase [Cellulomonas alba]
MSPVLLSWTSAQVRAAEEPLLASGVPLMERASFALAGVAARELRALRGRVAGSRVAVLVGAGNNGGDALFAGALLAGRGVRVDAVLAAERVHESGLAALVRAGGRTVLLGAEPGGVGAVADVVGDADLVVDGLLGIGARGGGVRGAAGELVTLLGERRAGGGGPFVVAVDLPSGVGVDDGTRAGPVLDADVTVTFGGAKPALLLPPAAAAAGRVEVVDLGLPLDAQPAVVRLEPADVAGLWPVPPPDAHKYTRGVLGVVAGTRAYPGAAVLVTTAAVLAGVGMVRYLGDVADLVVARRPEVVTGTGRVQAWTLGPGVSPEDAAQRRRVEHAFDGIVHRGEPAVVDAGALDLLPAHVGPHVVLTPHAGELARLLGERGGRDDRVPREAVEAEPLRWARRAHELTGATVLLKGAVTVVVGPHGVAYAQAEAPPWLATAGAGDVLAGLLGAMLAARDADVHDDPTLPAALAAGAALVHGHAADRANPGGPVAARAVAQALPATVAALLAGRS